MPKNDALLREILAGLHSTPPTLLGVDIPKDRATLELAHDDPAGVTAAFNLNIPVHVNRLLGADFDPARFRHEAIWNEAESRVEMHLRCVRQHRGELGGATLDFASGQGIRTECSYKYAPARVHEIGRQASSRKKCGSMSGGVTRSTGCGPPADGLHPAVPTPGTPPLANPSVCLSRRCNPWRRPGFPILPLKNSGNVRRLDPATWGVLE